MTLSVGTPSLARGRADPALTRLAWQTVSCPRAPPTRGIWERSSPTPSLTVSTSLSELSYVSVHVDAVSNSPSPPVCAGHVPCRRSDHLLHGQVRSRQHHRPQRQEDPHDHLPPGCSDLAGLGTSSSHSNRSRGRPLTRLATCADLRHPCTQLVLCREAVNGPLPRVLLGAAHLVHHRRLRRLGLQCR